MISLFVSFHRSANDNNKHNNKKRQNCIKEFIQTEKAYVDDMSIVHDVFEVPLRRSGVISPTDIDIIFVNWETILQCHRNFLADLHSWHSSGSDTIGYVIVKHVIISRLLSNQLIISELKITVLFFSLKLQSMSVYKTFCSKQLESAALLQKLNETSTAFRDLVKKCQNHVATKAMPLSSFLIKPMQRITRYPLLIGKILDSTPDDHPGNEK